MNRLDWDVVIQLVRIRARRPGQRVMGVDSGVDLMSAAMECGLLHVAQCQWR